MRTPKTTRLTRRVLSEQLEARQLLSATLSASSSLMVFNAVQNNTSQVETLTLTNSGDTTLSLGGLSIVADPSQSGDASARFAVTNSGSLPATLAAGATFTLNVDYVPTAKGLDYALLDIASNDPANPTTAIKLRGIGTDGEGGVHQPSLMRILKAYDLPNYNAVGETDETSAYYPEPPASNSTEVDLQQMVKAGPGDVTFNILASFTGNATNPMIIGWYQPSDLADTKVALFHTVQSDYQSVYVQPVGNTSFDPGSGAFGLYNPSQTVRGADGNLLTVYSQDSLNTEDTTDLRKFRFFPYITPDGTAVPNAYIMTSTEWPAPEGYDFTNIVAIITNVKPAAPVANADAATDTAGAAASINVLTNDTATTGTLTASSVTVTTAPASGATVSVDPTTGLITYTAPANFHGTDTFAYTIANSAGYTSAPATVTVNVSAGVGGIVTSPVTTTAVAGVAKTIDVLSVDTDSSGTLLPSSVVITSAPSAGGTATVNNDGTIAYTPAASFAGTETFSYTVGDSAGATSNPTTVTIAVSSPAAAPVSTGTSATTSLNAPVTITVALAVNSTVGLSLASIALVGAPTSGTATVDTTAGTITYVPASGFVGDDALSFTVADTNGHASATITVPVKVGVRVGTGGDVRSLTLPGSGSTLSLNVGLAEVFFTGAGALTIEKGNRGTTAGDSLVLDDVALTGTTAGSALSITGKGAVALNGLTADGVLGKLIAPATTIADTLTLPGVNTLQLAGLANATFTIGSSLAAASSLSLGTVTNSALTAAVPLKSLKATTWTNAGAGSIIAPSIGTLNVTGNFQPTLMLTSTGAALNTATIAGQLGGAAAWNVAGSVRTLTVGSITADTQVSITGALTTLTIRAGGLGSTLTAGSLGTATIRGDVTGTISAATAKTIKVTGNVNGATLAFTGAGTSLNTLTVSAALSNTTLTTAGNVGTLTAALLNGDSILIGAPAGTTFANVTTATLGSASLNALKLTTRAGPAFADSALIVHTLGTASVGTVITDAAGVTDGLALATAKSITGVANGTAFRLAHLSATQSFGDFQIKVPTA